MVYGLLGRSLNGETVQIANDNYGLFARIERRHRLLRIGDGNSEAGDGRGRRRGFGARLLRECRTECDGHEKKRENRFCGNSGFYLHGRNPTAAEHCVAMKINA